MITNEFNLTVDGTKSVDQLISAINGTYNKDSEDPTFRVAKNHKRQEMIVLFQFEREISHADILKEMETEHCEPAFVESTLSLLATEHNLTKISIISLGSITVDMDLQDYVLDAQIDEKGYSNFSPKPIGKGWGNWGKDWQSGKYRYFAAVRKN